MIAKWKNWFRNFLAFYSQQEFSPIFPEFRVRVPLGEYQAVAVYDLLALTPISAWSSWTGKPPARYPARHDQRPHADHSVSLCRPGIRRGNFLPEVILVAQSIQMTYVYVRHAADNILTFTYDDNQHAATVPDLEKLVAEIAALELGAFPLTEEKRRLQVLRIPLDVRTRQNAGQPVGNGRKWKPNP